MTATLGGDMSAAVRTEAIRTLYLQLRNSAAAAAVVTVYMVVTAWSHHRPRVILIWLAIQLATQVLREGMFQAYLLRRPEPDELPRWAAAYTAYMAVAGMVWGATIFLFAHPAQPVTVALTLCGLYGIAGGSVPGNAYNPPGLYAFVLIIFACVLVRMLMIGTTGYPALGVASTSFAAILVLFCRVQARTIADGFRIRFENRALVAELTLKRAEAEAAALAAQRANLAKSQFLAAASHDLRQPLYALSLFSASLDDLKLDAGSRDVVASIQKNIGALESLFDGLLDISKLDAGVIQPNFASVAVDELFDGLSHYFAPLAAERGLDLRWRSSSDHVRTDPIMLEQVLSNLISNALRCTRAGGILVATRRRGDLVMFEVWDTGIGIEEADIARIFDEFVQIGNLERDRRKGLGLGLSIAHRSVSLLGSGIDVRSRPGRGSCFRFAQQAVEARPPDQPVASSIKPVPGGARPFVLIVEDDSEVQHALSVLLRKWRIDFRIACDAREAIEVWQSVGRPDLALVDHRLPGPMSGLDLIRRWRCDFGAASARMLLLTGDLDAELIAAARNEGIPLLSKPFAPAELRRILESSHGDRPMPRRKNPAS